MEQLNKLKDKYNKLFTEIKNDSLFYCNLNALRLTSDYLEKIEDKIYYDEIFLQPEVNNMIVPIGECSTKMCNGLIDKIVDKNIKEVMGPEYDIKRNIYVKSNCNLLTNKMLMRAGIPINCKEIYEFYYTITWNEKMNE